jgi:hypothetical protein
MLVIPGSKAEAGVASAFGDNARLQRQHGQLFSNRSALLHKVK